MKTKTRYYDIDINVVFNDHADALKEAALAATKVFLNDPFIRDKNNSDDYYNDMLVEGVHYITQGNLIGKPKEELKSILFHHFMYSLKSHRRKIGRREQVARVVSLDSEVIGALVQNIEEQSTEHPMVDVIQELLETVPEELSLICKAFMQQEKKAISRKDVCRQLGMSDYMLRKKLSEIAVFLKNISNF